MEGLILDVAAPAGQPIPLAELLAAVTPAHLIAGALLILLAIVGHDLAHPQRGVRR